MSDLYERWRHGVAFVTMGYAAAMGEALRRISNACDETFPTPFAGLSGEIARYDNLLRNASREFRMTSGPALAKRRNLVLLARLSRERRLERQPWREGYYVNRSPDLAAIAARKAGK